MPIRDDYTPPPPVTIEDVLSAIGETGRHVSEIGASEGAAGNISVLLGWDFARHEEFSNQERVKLPLAVPELAGASVLVSGSGRRLREVHVDPFANLAHVEILAGGEEGIVWTSPRKLFQRPTSEFNTHLAIHARFAPGVRGQFHTVCHAQPLHLTYLSHIPRYADEALFNRHILRWQPETIVQIPEGVGVVPFTLPGSPELQKATLEKMESHQIVLWAKHGVIARSVLSIKRAGDLIEYAETGARYEYMNINVHGLADGLTPNEVRTIANAFGKDQKFF